jgi:hypothetical protein
VVDGDQRRALRGQPELVLVGLLEAVAGGDGRDLAFGGSNERRDPDEGTEYF